MTNDNNITNDHATSAPGTAFGGRVVGGAARAPRATAGREGMPAGSANGPRNGVAIAASGGTPASGVAGGAAARSGSGVAGGAGAPGGPRTPKKRTGRMVLIIAGVVLVALAIWLLLFLFACNGNALLDPTAQDGQAPYKSAEEIQAELDREVEEGMFNISIASSIQFDDGTSSGTAYIENIPGNRYLMKVSITSDDTGEVLYESGVL